MWHLVIMYSILAHEREERGAVTALPIGLRAFGAVGSLAHT